MRLPTHRAPTSPGEILLEEWLKPLKLPAELKAFVEAAAKVAGTSAHAFMMDAIERETTRSERFAELVHEAREADQEFDRTGSYYDAEDVFHVPVTAEVIRLLVLRVVERVFARECGQSLEATSLT